MPRTKGAKALPECRVIDIDNNITPIQLQDLLNEQASERFILQHTLRNGTRLILYKINYY